ncbi:MAG: hypothetical protein PHR00_00580 [Patescibacteria group bacterium]|nr:hypothetical protein [Patescibacteria group bacterium]
MFLLVHSKEIWYLILSIGFLTLIGFLCALLYNFILAAKDVREAAESVKRQIDDIEQTIKTIKKRLSFGSYAIMAGNIFKKMSKIFNEDKAGTRKYAKENFKNKAKNSRKSSDFMQEEL